MDHRGRRGDVSETCSLNTLISACRREGFVKTMKDSCHMTPEVQRVIATYLGAMHKSCLIVSIGWNARKIDPEIQTQFEIVHKRLGSTAELTAPPTTTKRIKSNTATARWGRLDLATTSEHAPGFRELSGASVSLATTENNVHVVRCPPLSSGETEFNELIGLIQRDEQPIVHLCALACQRQLPRAASMLGLHYNLRWIRELHTADVPNYIPVVEDVRKTVRDFMAARYLNTIYTMETNERIDGVDCLTYPIDQVRLFGGFQVTLVFQVSRCFQTFFKTN